MKINKEMAEHLLRFHLDYQTTSAKSKDLNNIFVLIRYLMNEIDELKKITEKETP